MTTSGGLVSEKAHLNTPNYFIFHLPIEQGYGYPLLEINRGFSWHTVYTGLFWGAFQQKLNLSKMPKLNLKTLKLNLKTNPLAWIGLDRRPKKTLSLTFPFQMALCSHWDAVGQGDESCEQNSLSIGHRNRLFLLSVFKDEINGENALLTLPECPQRRRSAWASTERLVWECHC